MCSVHNLMLGEHCAFPHTRAAIRTRAAADVAEGDNRAGLRLRRAGAVAVVAQDQSIAAISSATLRPPPSQRLRDRKESATCNALCHLFITLVVYLILPAAAMAQVVIGPGPAAPPRSQYIEPTGTRTIDAFPGFLGGVRVSGDVNGDDIRTSSLEPGRAAVRTSRSSAAGRRELASFFAYDPAFTGGVFVAAGDVNGDGFADIITGAGPGGGPHVRVFSGADLGELASFFAYDPASPAACSWPPATSTATAAPTSSPAPAPAAARTCRSSTAPT